MAKFTSISFAESERERERRNKRVGKPFKLPKILVSIKKIEAAEKVRFVKIFEEKKICQRERERKRMQKYKGRF